MRTLVLSIFALTLFSCANRTVYKSPDFTEKSSRHQTVAILPLRITQTGHVSKKETPEDIKKANIDWGYAFQENLHSYILRQTNRNRKGQLVSFQAIQKTNSILKEQGLTIEDMYDQKPEELAQLLGVDAVLMTTLEKDKNFSDGVAYGLAAGRLILNTVSKSPVGVPAPNASDINMNCYLYDAKDSKLLWKTYRAGGTDIPAHVDGQIEFYSNWIAKKLPYRS
jgi:hypothetical protein